MEELLISIARGLVEQPDEVRVDTDEPAEDGTIVYHLHVAEKRYGEGLSASRGRIAKGDPSGYARRGYEKTTAGFCRKSN